MPHTNLRQGEERQYAACWGQPVKDCEQEKVEQDVQTPYSRIDLVNVAAQLLSHPSEIPLRVKSIP